MDGQDLLLNYENIDPDVVIDIDLSPSEEDEEVEFLTPDDAPVWMNAADAADKLGVKVRHVRRLATAGKILRRKDEGDERTMYCLSPLFEDEDTPPVEGNPQTSRKSADEVRAGAGTGAILLSADTGEHIKVEVEQEVDRARLEKLLERNSKPIDSTSENPTVVLQAEDVEYLQDDVVPAELLRTNRELMRLVEGVMSRWTEAMQARGDASDDLKQLMTQAGELQQCLNHWQYHAGLLERQLMATAFLASRALDVADEAVATRWKSGRRLATLRERLDTLRGELGES